VARLAQSIRDRSEGDLCDDLLGHVIMPGVRAGIRREYERRVVVFLKRLIQRRGGIVLASRM
jgi:hypothetical protein